MVSGPEGQTLALEWLKEKVTTASLLTFVPLATRLVLTKVNVTFSPCRLRAQRLLFPVVTRIFENSNTQIEDD